ncbi:MAG: hypothetical protein AAFR20_04725 [Pseudomonadota bacterium]
MQYTGSEFSGEHPQWRDGFSNSHFFQLDRSYGKRYYRYNAIYAAIAIPLSIIAIAIALALTLSWTPWHTAALLALAGINALFLYLMPAPTYRGQKIRTHIEGFRRYLETAEKEHLNMAEAQSSETGLTAPPVLTKARYERFLPYAIALNVEKPWSEHFERRLPQEADDYQPHWGSTHTGHHGLSPQALNAAMIQSVSSGASSAVPQSSGTSGSGGGGFSGGGGGGGGGGGW